MTLQNKKDNADKLLNDLIQLELERVEYFKINETEYDFDNFHSVDFGLNLIFTNGKSYLFEWGFENHQFDLCFSVGNLEDQLAKRVSKLIVSSNKHWKTLIGSKIIGALSSWSTYTSAMHQVELQFEIGKSVYIQNVEVDPDGNKGSEDNICLFFDFKTVKDLNCVVK